MECCQGGHVWLLLPQGSTSFATVVLVWSIPLDQSLAPSRKSHGWPSSYRGGGPGDARPAFEAGPVVGSSTRVSSLKAPCPRAPRPRAYSSIGQSPRLITGLFLVRTQVGPLAAGERFLL